MDSPWSGLRTLGFPEVHFENHYLKLLLFLPEVLVPKLMLNIYLEMYLEKLKCDLTFFLLVILFHYSYT